MELFWGVTLQINFWTGAALAVPILVWFGLKVVELVQKHTKYWKSGELLHEEEAVKKVRHESAAIFQMVGQISRELTELRSQSNGLERTTTSYYEDNVRQQSLEGKDIASLTDDLVDIQAFFQRLNTELTHRFESHDKDQRVMSDRIEAIYENIISKSLAREQEKAFVAIERITAKIEVLVEQHSGSTGIAKNWWCQCTMSGQTPDWSIFRVVRDKTVDIMTDIVALGAKIEKSSQQIGELQQYVKTIVDPILMAVQQSVVLLTEVLKNIRELQLDMLRRVNYTPYPKERNDEET